MRSKSMLRFVLAGASAIALSSTAALAQDAPEDESSSENDIIVTATKRPENIQDVAMSITAVSGDMLEKQNIKGLFELQGYVPGLRITRASNPRTGGVFLRGVGQNGTNQGIEPSVGVFLDGVYLPVPGPIQSNLSDIGSIEVLRGPQGTLYGRNTPVGAININTRAPTQDFEAGVTASYGNYDAVNANAYVGGGLGENLAFRLSGWYSDFDGYDLNLFTGKRINKDRQYGVRGRIEWEPSEAVTVNLVGMYNNNKYFCCSPEILDFATLATPGFLANSIALGRPLLNTVTGDRKVEEKNLGVGTMQNALGALTIDADLGSLGKLTSITGYSWIDDGNRLSPYQGISRQTLNDNGNFLTRKGWTQELRLASPGKQTLDYLFGLFYLNEDTHSAQDIRIGRGANRLFPFFGGATFAVGDGYDNVFDQKTKSFAAFGQLTFNVTDRLHLIGGLRYTNDKKDAGQVTTVPAGTSALFRALVNSGSSRLGLKRSEDYVTYMFTGKYDLTDNVMAYVTYGTGTKSGGFNANPVSSATTPLEFRTEKSNTLEAGIKSSFLDGRVVINFDVYRMNVLDIQTSTVSPTATGFIVGNAGDRRSQGFELDVVVKPSDRLTLTGSLAYLDAKYTRYLTGTCATQNPGVPAGPSPNTCNFTGFRPYQSPPITASLAADYRAPLGGNMVGFLGGDVTFTDDDYLAENLDKRSKQQRYGLLNARIGVEAEDGRWRVSAFGRNLTNHDYYTASVDLVFNVAISAAAPGAVHPAACAGAGGSVGWQG
ncbi:MAG: TonB-dependent receptor, partial [Chakrabartia sp.]